MSDGKSTRGMSSLPGCARGTAWPLVGRAAELDALQHALEQGGAVVVGAAGVGKSRVVAEAARLAADSSRSPVEPVRIAGRVSAQEVPLSPFAPILPRDAGVLAPLDAPSVIADTLTDRWCGAGTPVLVVDDAQWLDPVSVTVLHQLAVDHRVRLLVTVRQGEQLAPEIVQLHADELLGRIELEALGAGAVHELLLAALDGPVEEATVANLVRVCAGNVLYLRELVLGSIEADLLVQQHGVWRFTGSLTATPRLREIVDARLAFVDGPAREALEVVAVAGVLELSVLVEVADEEVVESLERMGLLTVTAARGAAEVELGHPLHAEVLRSQIPAVARRRIARALATASEARAPWDEVRPDQRMQRALWHLEGDLPIDAARLLGAARESVSAGDQQLAARLATASFEIDGSAGAVILASWCRADLGEREEAERLLLDAIETGGVPVDQAAITIRLAEDIYWGRADPEASRRVLDESLAGPLGTDAAAVELIGAHRPIFTVMSGHVAAGLAEVEPFVGSSTPLAAMQAEMPRNLGEILTGRCTDAVARSGQALERAISEDFPYLVNPGPHIVAMCWGMLHDANLPGARAIAELVYAEAARRPGYADRGWAASVLGIVNMETGRLRDAARFFVEAEAMWRRAGVEAFARIACGLRVLVRAQCGDVDPGTDIDRLADEPSTMQFMEVYVGRGRAWSDWVSGRRDTAVDRLQDAVALGLEQGARVHAAGAAHDLTRIGRSDLAVAAFDAMGPFPNAGTPRLLASCAIAVESADLDQLMLMADALGEAGFELYAAEVGLEAARCAKRRGRTRDADRLASQAAARAALLGEVRTPMLDGVRRAGPLSRREHEVAQLAAGGMSNRQIATSLVLSERTVENHLYRVFTKLGISSRDEIAAVLDD